MCFGLLLAPLSGNRPSLPEVVRTQEPSEGMSSLAAISEGRDASALERGTRNVAEGNASAASKQWSGVASAASLQFRAMAIARRKALRKRKLRESFDEAA